MIFVKVKIWDHEVGVVSWNSTAGYSTFEIREDFIKHNINISPITMPWERILRGQRIFEFSELNYNTYNGLPGLLSDSLPDAYGNRLIITWLETQGRNPDSFSPIEKLSYIGKRGMGALEFEPSNNPHGDISSQIELSKLIELADKVLDDRKKLNLNLNKDEELALSELIKIGTSAGGQRPKAIIAYNPESGEIRSGQVNTPEGFGYYILKFDGIKSVALGDPEGFGKIEMAYHKMAISCGIDMMPCNLIHENNRSHFITKRFDRSDDNKKIHLQTLCAIAHYDYQLPGAYSYESAFAEMRDMGLPYYDFEQLYKRMVFNLIARNQDDHTKNISFILKQGGEWRLSPAYDVCWSFNPKGDWTSSHQMTINNKRDNFTHDDLLLFAKNQGIKKAEVLIEQVKDAVSTWSKHAKLLDVEPGRIRLIEKTHRMHIK